MSLLTCEILGTGWILVSLPWREYFSMLMCMSAWGFWVAHTLGMFPHLYPTSSYETAWPGVSLLLSVTLRATLGLVPYLQVEVRDLNSELINRLSKWADKAQPCTYLTWKSLPEEPVSEKTDWPSPHAWTPIHTCCTQSPQNHNVCSQRGHFKSYCYS